MPNTFTESTNVSLNIKAVFILLRKRIIPILLCAALCGLGCLFYFSIIASPQYTATVSIIVDNRTIGNTDSAELALKSTSDITASRLLTDTYIAIFSTSSFLESVSSNVNNSSELIYDGKIERTNSTDLKDMIKMSAVNNTEILEIKVSSTSPQLSVDICYAIMDEAKRVLADTMDQSEVKSVEGDNILLPEKSSSPSALKKAVLGAFVGAFGCAFVYISIYAFSKQPAEEARAIESIPASAQVHAPETQNEPALGQNAPADEPSALKPRPRPRPQRQAPTAPRQ